MIRIIALALLLALTLSASAQFMGGMSGIGGAVGGAGGGGGGGACTGTIDLSTGCSQLVAFGGLF